MLNERGAEDLFPIEEMCALDASPYRPPFEIIKRDHRESMRYVKRLIPKPTSGHQALVGRSLREVPKSTKKGPQELSRDGTVRGVQNGRFGQAPNPY